MTAANSSSGFPWRTTPARDRSWRLSAALAVLFASAAAAGGCGAVTSAVPRCASVQRLALVAQSVPAASYVPCIGTLPPGWTSASFDAHRGSTTFSLVSDRANGHPVEIALVSKCELRGATFITSRAPGVSTYTRLRSISPLYAGTLVDVFTGGCVTYRFAFERGPHIALMEDFESAVTLYSRQQLSLELHRRLGVTLQP